MKKRVCFGITILLCICMLVGCGKQAPQPAPVPTDLKEGGTGVVSLPITHFDTFNPILTRSDTVLDAMQLVYDSMYRRAADGKCAPLLATGADVSADGLVYTIHLREDVKWHDGSGFSSADVAHTVQAIENAPQTTLGKCLAGVVSHGATGMYTYRFELAEPNSCFTEQLTFPIVKHGTDCTQVQSSYVPVGTSAYVYVPSTLNRAYVFHKNGACVTTPLGTVEEVILKVIPEADNSIYALESREIEAVHADTDLLRTYSPKGNVRTITYTNRRLTFLGIGANGNLADKRVRRALSLFIDRETIKKNVMFDRFVPVYLPLTDSRYYNQDTESERAQEAQTLLQSAGFLKNTDGFWEKETEEGRSVLSVSVLVNMENEVRCKAAENIAAQLVACGIKAYVDKTDYETYALRISENEYSLFLGETILEDDLDVFALAGSTARYTGADGANMDAVLYNLKNAVTQQGRESAQQSLASALADEMPVIALGYGQNALIVNDRISGEICPVYGNVFANFAAWTAL